MLRSVVLALGVVVVGAGAAGAQAPPPVTPTLEEGRALVRVHRPREVGGGGQTWAFVQDPRGVIYAGTNGAVLVFDGGRLAPHSARRRWLGALAGHRRHRTRLGRICQRLRVSGARRARRAALCLAQEPTARGRPRLQRHLAYLGHRRRRLLPERARDLQVGQRQADDRSGRPAASAARRSLTARFTWPRRKPVSTSSKATGSARSRAPSPCSGSHFPSSCGTTRRGCSSARARTACSFTTGARSRLFRRNSTACSSAGRCIGARPWPTAISR